MEKNENATLKWDMLYQLLDGTKHKMDSDRQRLGDNVSQRDIINVIDFFYTNAQNIIMLNQNNEANEAGKE